MTSKDKLKIHFIQHGHLYSAKFLILMLFLNERDYYRLGKFESFIYDYLKL